MATPATSPPNPPLPYGAQVVLRYRYPDGRLQAALPMRVVEDRADRLVAWLAPRPRSCTGRLPTAEIPASSRR